MLAQVKAVETLGFSTISALRAVQEVRDVVETSSDPIEKAKDIFKNITGLTFDVESKIDALHIAQIAVESAVKSGLDQDYIFQPDDVLQRALEKVKQFRNNPNMQYIYTAEQVQEKFEEKKEFAGVEVAVRSDGKIKKGGKQVVALQLFKEYVVEKKISNKEFIAVLMEQLDMSKSGATTYAYNTRKAYEEETGEEVHIEKSKRGRKKKVVDK